MPTAVDITTQHTQDPNTKVYHTRYELTDKSESGMRGDDAELSEMGRLFLGIRGVVQVQMSTYVLLITKAPLFDWGEVEPAVGIILNLFVTSQRQLGDVPLKLVVEPLVGVPQPRPPVSRVQAKARKANPALS